MKGLLFSICFFAGLFSAASAKTVNVSSFGVYPNGKDSTPGTLRAIEHCRKTGAGVLSFPRGTYHFGPEAALQRRLHISNNDGGDKRIAFPIEGMENFELQGNGSLFVFHGGTNPFWVSGSRNVALKNFSVTVGRTFHNEGLIVENSEDGFTLQFDPKFDYFIRDGLLKFSSGKSRNKNIAFEEFEIPYNEVLEFDSKRRETAYLKGDIRGHGSLRAEDLGGRRVRIKSDRPDFTPGNILVFSFGRRDYPCMVLDKSEDVLVENVAILASGGMGVVAQNCKNVSVVSCKTLPAEGFIVSCTADATHFSNCTGKILIKDNVFLNQKDDATNIHGIYERIAEMRSPVEIVTQLVHPQQYGFETFKAGDTLEFVKGRSLIEKGVAEISEVEVLNDRFKRLVLKTPVPEGIEKGDAVAVVRDYPEIVITGNTIGRNRARGILLNCRGKTLVENNTFHNAGAAVMFQGDASVWFEQGGVRDCTIRNNVFDNCMYGPYGNAVITVDSGIREDRAVSRYNRNIRVENNTFRVFDGAPLVDFYCVDGFVWRGNKIEKTSDYPPRDIKDPEPVKIRHFNNVEIRD